MGGYLDHLDLSRSLITGSSMSTIAVKSPFEEKDYRLFLEKFYPKYITVPLTDTDKRLHEEFIKETLLSRSTWLKPMIEFKRVEDLLVMYYNYDIANTEAFQSSSKLKDDRWHYREYKDEKNDFVKGSIRYKIVPGADVDIMVYDAKSIVEFDTIARQHYEAIKKVYPGAEMEKRKTTSSHKWRVLTRNDVKMREVDIYWSKFQSISTYHMPCVRAAWLGNDRFVGLPSYVSSIIRREITDCRYVAGKHTPCDIILKYMEPRL